MKYHLLNLTAKKTFICAFFLLFVHYSGYAQKLKPVNLFMGTEGDHGQADPAASVPFGALRVGPDMSERSHSGYDFAKVKIAGFSINRLSGIGCGGNGGNLRITPSGLEEPISIVKHTEKAIPGYYGVSLSNGVTVQLSTTQHVALERYVYPVGVEQRMVLNISSSFTGVREIDYQIVNKREIQGKVSFGTTCDNGTYTFYFHFLSSEDFLLEAQKDHKLQLKFSRSGGSPIDIRIATSGIDVQTARMENQQISTRKFDDLSAAAAKLWKNQFNKIKVTGGTIDEQTLFYTGIYRTMLSPFNISSFEGKYRSTANRIEEAKDFQFYSSWSIWDSYRTKFPLLNLLAPAETRDIYKSLSRLYSQNKANWATKNEVVPTVRTEHGLILLLDGYRKGLKDIDLEIAYPGIRKELDSLKTNRPDEALETCYDFWAASNIAKILDKQDDSERYKRLADSIFRTTWNHFFAQVDSNFTKMRGSGLYQGTKWIYRWTLPQYLDEMKKSVGGEEALRRQLDVYFEKSYYNQGNEPGIHAPYIYNRLGAVDKTQQVVHRFLTQEIMHRYGGNAEYPKPIYRKIFENNPKGFLPEMDEDDGTMSAWYVFSAIGLFPLVVGESHYELTSPLFNKIEIQLENGKKLTIVCKHREHINDPIKTIKFNQKMVENFQIDHNVLLRGGRLEFNY